MDEQQLESEIKAKGADVAPRITVEMVDACIAAEFTGRASFLFGSAGAPVHAALDCLTICILVLQNGFTIIGKSACASPENYNEEIGHKIARADARQQIWALEGYRLRSMLQQAPPAL